MNKFEKLRSEYESFVFEKYDISFENNNCRISFYYDIPGLDCFKTEWVIPSKVSKEDAILHKLVWSLGMAEAISYYKITCAKTVDIKCGTMTDGQVKWWKKLFYNGLGEFQFINNIDIGMEELFTFRYSPEKNEAVLKDNKKYTGFLIPIGGGKDSVVTLNLLKDKEAYSYDINGNETTKNNIIASDFLKGSISVKRKLDKKILEYNQKGFLNGHIPFSAVVAFSAVITAYLNGIKSIALSNENSANESTVKDSFVNHQYSKSFEFEKDFCDYIEKITDSDIHYFSLLRPLSEMQIAMLFSKYKNYHKIFRSCNVGSKKGIWCCDCAKCLFVYIILSPFLTDAELMEIFGENLLNKESLDKEFRELVGIDENKPFECVGTREEVDAALNDYIEKGRVSLLTERYKTQIPTSKRTLEQILGAVSYEHNLTSELFDLVESSVLR